MAGGGAAVVAGAGEISGAGGGVGLAGAVVFGGAGGADVFGTAVVLGAALVFGAGVGAVVCGAGALDAVGTAALNVDGVAATTGCAVLDGVDAALRDVVVALDAAAAGVAAEVVNVDVLDAGALRSIDASTRPTGAADVTVIDEDGVVPVAGSSSPSTRFAMPPTTRATVMPIAHFPPLPMHCTICRYMRLSQIGKIE